MEVPAKGTVTLWDGSLKHFGLRVSQGGTKSFILLLGSGRRQTIGRYPTITVAQARTKAKTILAERTLGLHTPQVISWERALELFLEVKERETRPLTAYLYRSTLGRVFGFGTKKLCDISKSDISQKLQKYKDRPSQQSHAFVYLKVFLKWSVGSGYLRHNPLEGLSAAKQRKRKRILTDAELKAVWNAANEIGGIFGAIVKLIMLTGQRRSEIGGLKKTYFSHNQQTISLPGELTKNHRDHCFPVGILACGLLQPDLTSEYYFPSRCDPERPFNGWSKCKRELDKISGVTGWVLHDLRRTFRTGLAGLKVQPHIAERLVNHVSARSEMEEVYDLHSYLPEMRDATEKWETRLRQIVSD